MDRGLELELLKRSLAQVQEGRRDMAGSIHLCAVPDYFDVDRFLRERDVLFRRYPIVVGHVSRLRSAGDFITHDKSGVPVLVVRNASGKVNAFINACRHRGSLVAQGETGHCDRAFSCPYHAWTYNLDGALVGIPSREAFVDAGLDKRGLIPLPVAVRHGLIFVVPSPGAGIDIDSYLGEVGRQLAGFDLASECVFRTETIPARFNWKIGIDGALELYHFPTVHRNSASYLFASPMAKFEKLERHARLLVPKRSIVDIEAHPEENWRLRDQALLIYFLFPNTIVLLPEDHAIVFSVFPDGAEACLVEFTLLIPAADSADRHEHWDRTARLSRKVIEEDFAIGEGIQRACRATADGTVVYGRNEPGLTHFHRQCDLAIAGNFEGTAS
jgi:phenylpropionate dioxygenase-like ring-hydroxylating dioxygenase large terminal subunit